MTEPGTELLALAQDLLACAAARLAAAGRPARRVVLAPGGDVPWDDCCAGQVWVRVASLAPSIQQPNCGVAQVSATLTLGCLRCVSTLDDAGNAPTPEQVMTDTANEIADAHLLLDAIECCWRAHGRDVTEWTPLGVEGACAGGEWSLTVPYDPCLCQDR